MSHLFLRTAPSSELLLLIHLSSILDDPPYYWCSLGSLDSAALTAVGSLCLLFDSIQAILHPIRLLTVVLLISLLSLRLVIRLSQFIFFLG